MVHERARAAVIGGDNQQSAMTLSLLLTQPLV